MPDHDHHHHDHHHHDHDHDHHHGPAGAGTPHQHLFLGAHHDRNARKTWTVVAFCTAMMAIEIGGGVLFNSMALLADGVHMATHAGTLLIAALAYKIARDRKSDRRFSFGTGKVGDLAAFASAIGLAATSIVIAVESVLRLLEPRPIAFDQALPVAVLGLVVNIVSAWMLNDEHHHHHGDDHDHHHHHDNNMRAAYFHVAADALVSLLAIVGLLLGRYLGWVWMDPVMGLVGAGVILQWAIALMRSTGGVLLDMEPAGGVSAEIRRRIETSETEVVDLHVWRLGPGHNAAIVGVAGPHPPSAEAVRARLADLPGLSHLTVEITALEHDHHDHHPSAAPGMDKAAKPAQGGTVSTPA